MPMSSCLPVMHPGPRSPQQTLSTFPVLFDVAAKTITEHAVTKRNKMLSMPNKTLWQMKVASQVEMKPP